MVAREFTILALLASAATASLFTPLRAEEPAGPRGAVFAASTIYPGDTIAPEMLIEGNGASAASLPVYVQNRAEAVGKVARRTLLRGQPIPKNALRKKDIVFQGKPYTLLFRTDHMTISGLAFAMQSGAEGETIKARNPDTGVMVNVRVGADQVLLAGEP